MKLLTSTLIMLLHADFLYLCSALLAAFPADHYHSSSKVVAVDDSHQEYVIMELDSGERIAGHMLVAADG